MSLISDLHVGKLMSFITVIEISGDCANSDIVWIYALLTTFVQSKVYIKSDKCNILINERPQQCDKIIKLCILSRHTIEHTSISTAKRVANVDAHRFTTSYYHTSHLLCVGYPWYKLRKNFR